jgi:hypothetical protein
MPGAHSRTIVVLVLLALVGAVTLSWIWSPKGWQVQVSGAESVAPVVPLPARAGEWQVSLLGQAATTASLDQVAQAYAAAWREAGWETNLAFDERGDRTVATLAALREGCGAVVEMAVSDSQERMLVVARVTCTAQ